MNSIVEKLLDVDVERDIFTIFLTVPICHGSDWEINLRCTIIQKNGGTQVYHYIKWT